MYEWLVFVHITGALLFALAHGVSVAVLFGIRRERNRDRLQALLGLSGGSMSGFYVATLILLAGGVAAGFAGNWWGRLWIWLAIGLFVLTAVLMYVLATRWFATLRNAVGMRPSGAPMASDEEIDALLASARPVQIAVLGFGGLLMILWLMVFKPI